MNGRPALEIAQLTAGYGRAVVLDRVDLDVAPGQFVAILGASGCGKTTLLRAVAGFQAVMSGTIASFGRDVTALPPERRDLAMVFQSYALWPHMTVAGNIGYGLRLRRVPRAEIARRIAAILALLNLDGLENRKVTNLSGGQRQRVALGRALAVEPRLLLLDEPLSNLDAKVRLKLRGEIKALQGRLGFAAIHVTHDREEAMTMADQIVVMEAGRIAQQGTPEDVYHRPQSPFVAAFMGAENRLALEVAAAADGLQILPGPHHQGSALRQEAPLGPVEAYFRDDAARLAAPDHRGPDEITLTGRITQKSYPGGHYLYAVAVGDRDFAVKDARAFDVGTPVGLSLPVAALHLFGRDAHGGAGT
jgi:ABC-type Fe3+/spermidine/putrescine transport system ATPase subunit